MAHLLNRWVQLLSIAARNVVSHRRRAALTALAVLLGVMAVTAMRGALNGVQKALRSEAIDSQIGAIQVHRSGYMAQIFGAPLDLDLPADAAFLNKIRAVPNVRAAAPRIQFGGMVSSGDATTFAMLQAVDPEMERLVCPSRSERLSEGELVSAAQPDGLVLSAELARRIGAARKPGDIGRVAVLANDRDGSLNAVDTRLIGLNGLPKSPGLETRLGVIGLGHAQELLRMPGRATEIAIAVDDLEQVEATRQALAGLLGKDYEVATWPELAKTVADATALQDKVLRLMTAVLLIVALVGVVNAMLMSVLERTREIGVMLALGMKRQSIVGLFFLESLVITAGAALPGLGLARVLLYWLARANLSFQAPGGGLLVVRPELHGSDVAVVLSAVVVGAIGAALIPARHAARLRPVEALTQI